NGPAFIIKFDSYKDNYNKARSRGVNVRCVTEVTKDNIRHCKEFKNLVDELRHLEGFKGSIVVSESEFIGTTSWREEQLLNPVIYSNEKEFVEQHQNIFDIIWKKSKPYAQRITEIEEGTEPEFIETTDNPLYAQNKVFDLLNSANKEILIIFSTSNAFRRQARDGAVQKLTEIMTNRPWIETKILTPKDSEIERMVAELPISNLCVRFIEALSKVSILMVDRKYSLVAELKDDTKQLVTEAIGFVTYSNSAPTVLSYAAIFDSLWKQTEMYEQLQIHDRMQKEFINTAAHELRTPIQPILGITELVKKEIKDDRQRELLEVISRNAQRLKNLSEDILEASKIESNSLHLNKEHFKIKELIIEVINSYRNNTDSKNIRFEYALDDDNLTIHADRNGLSRVISNLINNSIKFTHKDGGIISVFVERKGIKEGNKEDKEAAAMVVSVKDIGTGIDKEILPKLFRKFNTKSFHGMGLGLYISKNIVNAHGGKIWAENNLDNTGATFSFKLPI
ncbi:MAG TPA: HAMP domain-containing sensor histidine kinase, partial [Phototrophicaceae bacterium]|nr:HAMP domain-containing sensor histidine kinase [Phototrophicaceae bacterium]